MLKAGGTSPVASLAPSPRLLVSALSIVALTVAVLQTAVVPVLGLISEQLHSSTVAVSWTVTANLLAAAAATPLLSRLADLFDKKYVLLGVLAVVLIGSVLAATTTSLPVLIAARALQGVSYSLYPICVAVLRQELDETQVVRALAVLSAILGFGGGIGLVTTGLLVTGDADYHRVFWLTTGFTLLVILVVVLVVPSRRRDGEGTIDWLGAVGLAVGLSAILLAITQGNSWGWAAPATLAAGATGVAVLALWWWWERGRRYPLVSIALLTRRAMLLTNLATVFVGMGLYFSFLGLTAFVQAPREVTGYGFSASVLYASIVYLLPGAVAGLVIAVMSGRFINRFGARPVLMVGALIGVAGFVGLAVAHSQPWQVIVAGIFANAYVSLAYGALPALVVSEAAHNETGIATGLNAIARTVGSAVAAAVVAVLLGHVSPLTGQPPESAYIITFAAGAVTAALATVLIALSRGRRGRESTEYDTVESRAMNHEWG
ncbi:MFS transporter [Mycobacterium sp. MS1601]|uniref:MFS transporter n=1 Tax=Mycobacterium sp. MS1601 TaxID=1936029 RepID=UPI0009794A55|nr:MFS transporter [Mycobacterium sp. MS1601]AQA06789.1 MFS transporter [Mycobacterium sp. MS1601]